jgi:molybdopterin-guanine dinucleotide biosynthesis protein A
MKNIDISNVIRKVTGVVLAGGKSRRMGRDKSIVVFDGKPLLIRAVNVLEQLFGETIIVTNQEIPRDVRAELGGAKIIHDEIPHLGPLGGISAALKASKSEIVFVMAVDMPFASTHAIEGMSKLANIREIFEEKVDAAVPVSDVGYEPLFAFYHKRCLEIIDRKLAGGERKVISIFDSLNVKTIDIEKLRYEASRSDEITGTGLGKAFININTESDLKQAESLRES